MQKSKSITNKLKLNRQFLLQICWSKTRANYSHKMFSNVAFDVILISFVWQRKQETTGQSFKSNDI